MAGNAGWTFVDMCFEQPPGGARIVVTSEELDFDLTPKLASSLPPPISCRAGLNYTFTLSRQQVCAPFAPLRFSAFRTPLPPRCARHYSTTVGEYPGCSVTAARARGNIALNTSAHELCLQLASSVSRLAFVLLLRMVHWDSRCRLNRTKEPALPIDRGDAVHAPSLCFADLTILMSDFSDTCAVNAMQLYAMPRIGGSCHLHECHSRCTFSVFEALQLHVSTGSAILGSSEAYQLSYHCEWNLSGELPFRLAYRRRYGLHDLLYRRRIHSRLDTLVDPMDKCMILSSISISLTMDS